jgi:hypothetical protein
LQPTRATQQGQKRKVEAPGPKKPAKRSRSSCWSLSNDGTL